MQQGLEEFSVSVSLQGPNQDILQVSHDKKEIVIAADALMSSKPEIFDQMKERQFRSLHFKAGDEYSRIVPIE